MSTTSGPNLTFRNFNAPGLPSGSLTISVTQVLGVTGLREQPVELTLTQKVTIAGPQFALGASDIHAQYPPPGATDDFSSDLPYVVFTRRSLPWERSLTRLPPADADKPRPWMALLVFAAGEAPEPIAMTIGDYRSNKVAPSPTTPLASISVSVDPSVVNDLDPCACIEIPLGTLKALAPKPEELRFLAHCRELDEQSMTSKAGVELPHAGAFSIVMANRLPARGQRNVVHLVSLEGCQDHLGKPVVDSDKGLSIRLISLASWSFQCTDGRDSFRAIVGGLLFDAKPDGALSDVPRDLRLRLPSAGVSGAAKARLDAGFVPVPYHLMDGRESFAWYRGPLAPAPAPPSTADRKVLLHSSSATIFDESTGVFDQTYAAAWQLGRLLALADPAFGVQLMTLRGWLHDDIDAFPERWKVLKEAGKTKPPPPPPGMASALSASTVDPKAVALALDDDDSVDRLLARLPQGTAPPAFSILDKPPSPSAGVSFSAFDEMPEAPIDEHVRLAGLLDLLEGGASRAPAAVAPGSAAQSFAASFADAGDDLSSLDKDLLAKITKELYAKYDAELNAIVDWLAALSITDLPRHHVVPHPGLLPQEALRVFRIHEEWWQALFDGALSLGIHTRIDEVVATVLAGNIATRIRDRKSLGTWGILLRSRLIKAWSGVEIAAVKNDAPLQPTTCAKLGDDVVLFVFPDVPDELRIELPKEGLRFALPAGADAKLGVKKLDGTATGTSVAVGKRTGAADGVIDVAGLVDAAKGALPGVDVGSAALALQLIAASERFVLKPSVGG